jgi:hypothetical protein
MKWSFCGGLGKQPNRCLNVLKTDRLRDQVVSDEMWIKQTQYKEKWQIFCGHSDEPLDFITKTEVTVWFVFQKPRIWIFFWRSAILTGFSCLFLLANNLIMSSNRPHFFLSTSFQIYNHPLIWWLQIMLTCSSSNLGPIIGYSKNSSLSQMHEII